ncbi:hypothetical protein GCM10010289_30260 [Streptomyces violascens]|uniref:Uncharacterized protein n=1 Tax=Streptomyces violascens TaxID=67381 RepID=A0ABQ3QU44_9ACTN|nr:hypothetical protein GCM10010289_30260 [Streptomyces violascens]GHI40772.1 hypothetical protein Sviol_51800 [Streptomyces violascens]
MDRSPTPERAVTVPRGVSRRTATPVTPASRSASASPCTDRALPEGSGEAEAAAEGKDDAASASAAAANRKRREIMT